MSGSNDRESLWTGDFDEFLNEGEKALENLIDFAERLHLPASDGITRDIPIPRPFDEESDTNIEYDEFGNPLYGLNTSFDPDELDELISDLDSSTSTGISGTINQECNEQYPNPIPPQYDVGLNEEEEKGSERVNEEEEEKDYSEDNSDENDGDYVDYPAPKTTQTTETPKKKISRDSHGKTLKYKRERDKDNELRRKKYAESKEKNPEEYRRKRDKVNERQRKRRAKLKLENPEEYKKLLLNNREAVKAHYERMKKDDPEEFEAQRLINIKRVKAHYERMKKDDPEEFEAQRLINIKRVKAYYERMKTDDPGKYAALLDGKREAAKKRYREKQQGNF